MKVFGIFIVAMENSMRCQKIMTQLHYYITKQFLILWQAKGGHASKNRSNCPHYYDKIATILV